MSKPSLDHNAVSYTSTKLFPITSKTSPLTIIAVLSSIPIPSSSGFLSSMVNSTYPNTN